MPTSWATLVVLPRALLTARICQLYPNAAPSTIVAKFFPSTTSGESPLPADGADRPGLASACALEAHRPWTAEHDSPGLEPKGELRRVNR
jgi:hypothetical protein